jgi:hypothetical protein
MIVPTYNDEWQRIKASRSTHTDVGILSLRPASGLPLDKPVFFVEVVIGMQRGSPTQRLTRAAPWDMTYSAPAGRYACFPVWDWQSNLLPPEEPMVTVPVKLLEQVKEAFNSGLISDELFDGMHKALGRG